MGQVQQPITNFTEPWDDFMVHGVNIPGKILVILNTTGYMLTSFDFDAFIHLRNIL